MLGLPHRMNESIDAFTRLQVVIGIHDYAFVVDLEAQLGKPLHV